MRITKHPLSPRSPQLETIPDDSALIDTLQVSFLRLMEPGRGLAERFFQRLFAAHPELRPLFSHDLATTGRKLVEMLAGVVGGLRRPAEVTSVLERLGRDHVAFGVRREHYRFVEEALVAALADTAGAEWSDDLEAEWRRAIGMIADIMLRGAGMAR